ncbi:hypothetical protein [Mastigocladopsis repens]|uniref:hypothetical protein n=1 Tax=Mastigocladopsis repens TaxID=221287 RepID=UPI0012EA2FDF|nr:hypothetical protein [Mastigocladopsis repens]
MTHSASWLKLGLVVTPLAQFLTAGLPSKRTARYTRAATAWRASRRAGGITRRVYLSHSEFALHPTIVIQ